MGIQCSVGYISIVKMCGLWIKDHKLISAITKYGIMGGGMKTRKRRVTYLGVGREDPVVHQLMTCAD